MQDAYLRLTISCDVLMRSLYASLLSMDLARMRNPTVSLRWFSSALLCRSSPPGSPEGAIPWTIRRHFRRTKGSTRAANTQTSALHKYLDWWYDLGARIHTKPSSLFPYLSHGNSARIRALEAGTSPRLIR